MPADGVADLNSTLVVSSVYSVRTSIRRQRQTKVLLSFSLRPIRGDTMSGESRVDAAAAAAGSLRCLTAAD